ncbi:MAG: cysteine dioxygenase family protein, partial [Planctomycetes bacterium]|nr:cysteine dioxygenase family protein [Planctomycetota bacterium]
YVSRRCEITVLCLTKGQVTPIHDHGGAIGATVIHSGSMTEELFNRQPGGLIVPISTHKASINEITTVDICTIHRVSNMNSEGLVTINIYFPPLTMMNIYNLENTRVEKWVNFSQK